MQVTVLFFASFKEILNCSSQIVEINAGARVKDLCELLSANGDIWQQLFDHASQKVKVAVNQQMADWLQPLNEGDEVAFFPPVTGG